MDKLSVGMEDLVSGDADPTRGVPVDPDTRLAVGPGPAASSSFDPTRLDFGHYAGMTIARLALDDPDYLHWLARHPSGVRYRAEIARVLGGLPIPRPY